MEFETFRKKNILQLVESIHQDADLYENTGEEKENTSESHMATAINKKFECIQTHCEGLRMLSAYSSKISNENLIKHFPHWIAKATQILKNAHNDSIELALVCRGIGDLFKNCKQIAELDKRISMYHIKIIVGIIIEKYSSNENIHLINLLIVLLYQYPESCARFQGLFSEVILSCVDHKQSNFVFAGAKVYSLLIRALERSSVYSNKVNLNYLCDSNAANCHVHHQIDLCNNLCKIMDELFQDVIDVSSGPYKLETIKNNILQLPEISCQNIIEYYADMEIRFFNICTYLSTLLSAGGSGGKKFVFPDILLQVICRGMAIKPINLKKHDNEHHDKMMINVLAKLQFGLLKILESLTASFQVELVPFAQTIQNLLLQTMEWTNQISHKSYKSVKLLVYKILSLWLKETRSLSGFQLIADEFLLHLYKDLLPANNNLTLITAKKNKNDNESKKSARIKEIKNLENNCPLADSDLFLNYADATLFLQVTSTIQTILLYSINNLTSSFYDKVRDLVILLLLEHYVKKSKSTVLKTNAECRLQLVKTLRILQTNHHIASSCAASYAVQIFGIIISEENNTDIVQEASHGLTVLRQALNPSSPSLTILQSKLNNATTHNHHSDYTSCNDNLSSIAPKRARIEVNSSGEQIN